LMQQCESSDYCIEPVGHPSPTFRDRPPRNVPVDGRASRRSFGSWPILLVTDRYQERNRWIHELGCQSRNPAGAVANIEHAVANGNSSGSERVFGRTAEECALLLEPALLNRPVPDRVWTARR